jgi:hypothetical protein
VYTCNTNRLAVEILHFNIKYHVKKDLLVGWRDCLLSIYNLECTYAILHLLPHRILPKSVFIFFAMSHTFIPALVNFNSKIFSVLVIKLCCISNNYTVLIEEMWGPPHKTRGVKKALLSSILSNFNWVDFLEIHQALPAYSPIFPFNTQVSTLCCFPHLYVASILDVHIIRFNGMSISLVVINAFLQVIFFCLQCHIGHTYYMQLHLRYIHQ